MLRGIKVVLRDKEYTLAPVPVDDLAEIWPQVCKVLRETPSLTDAANFDKAPDIIKAAADVVFASMRLGNDPEVTREKVGHDILDYGNWHEAFLAVLKISNIKTEKAGEGNAAALTMVRTGTESGAISPAPSDGPSTTSAS
jgi:hypothetical protein